MAALPNTQEQTQGGRQNEEAEMPQIKEQNKTPEKELNKMETSKLPDAEFKTLIVRMVKELVRTSTT